ncbi:MAG TPA: cyclic nucleotide-binding domain-containing protein [Magnetococcales bacterium]|nr:cyclic nucleotide-binding domain-containing protein [Magnetococcales bacterium]
MLSLGLFLEYRKTATSFEEWYESLFPLDSVNLARELVSRFENRGTSDHAALTPFMDILAYGTREQKQTMIAKMSRHFKPAFAPVFREAVNNADNSVRVLAATAISHVENGFMKTTMKLQRQLEKHGDDQELLMKVARHFDDFAFTGLLDPVREGENRKKAISGYRACLKANPLDQEVVMALGRTLVRSAALEEAAEFLSSAIRQGQVTRQLVIWSMEALFELKRFDQLADLARQHQHLFSGEDHGLAHVRDRVDLWSGRYTGDGLHRVRIFDFIDAAQRASLVATAEIFEFNEGEFVARQGDSGDSLFVILSGMVVLSVEDSDKGAMELLRLGEGKFFGEMSLLTGATRNSSVMVLTEKCRLMKISSQAIVPILQGRPDILDALALDIAQRQVELAEKKKARFVEVDPQHLAQVSSDIREQMNQHLTRS